jgi:ABC-type glycerol-3-phosphate transport system substrate-binding protein
MSKINKIISVSLIVAIMFHLLIGGQSFVPIQAAEEFSLEELYDTYMLMENVPDTDYQKYLSKYSDQYYSGNAITYSAESLYSGEMMIEESQEVELTIDVPEAAVFVLSFDYQTLGANILPTKMALQVNGRYPYDELKRLFVSDTWVSGETQYDRYGNECISMPVKKEVWGLSYLHDTAYLFSEPMMIYLEEGENTLTLRANEGSVKIGNLYLSAKSPISKDTSETAVGEELIVIEAEKISYRNSPNIRAESEYITDITPYDPSRKMINMVSESSFKTGGTKIEYEFTVDNDGYYNLAFDYRQSTKSDFTVYRNIYIDGEIPSQSFGNMGFEYSKKYSRTTVPAAVYLTKGTHLLSIEVSLDPMRNSINILNAVTDEINSLALKVNKITGGNTDKYRDFDLEEYDFHIEEKLLHWATLVDQVHAALSTLNPGTNNVGEISQLKIASEGLRRLAEKPNELPQKMNQFSYGTSSARQNITNVVENISVGQLGLDKIIFYQKEAKLPKKVNFFKALLLNIQHFFASFTNQDYNPNYDQDNETLQIWVARPRQYIEIMQRMADSSFTEQYGVNVELSIVPDQQKLILSNASGKAPDAAIAIGSGFVYDLALRGALANLREFDNFKEVGRRFAPGMLIPGVCDNGVYAIPETFNFYVLFYRTDILEAIDLEVPNTMDEVREMLPELARMGLSFNTHVANYLAKTFSTTTPFIFQSGGVLIKEGEVTANLDSPEVINGMKYLTENFTIYDMDYEVLSFYQAFRDGRMPIGVSDYATFNLLINAAPELTDSWAIAPYPGIENEEGEVLRYTSGAAESCVVFNSSKNSQAAFDFIDWWMSTEVQTEFAYTLQSTLGNEYLWNSANLDAIMASPWSTKHKEIIMEQISWTLEAPRLPGSYIIERELGNVLINVVTKSTNIRTAVDDAQKKINRELQRKFEEFGYYDSDGNMLKELIIPDIDLVKEWLE